MGRKKSRRTTIKRTRVVEKMPKQFNCPQCSHENVVICKINKAKLKGTAHCVSCGAVHKTTITNLTTAIDVYSDWIDNMKSDERDLE